MTGNGIKYGLEWSENIVGKLKGAHARATEFLLRETGISERTLVIWLAKGSKEYYVVREMLRFIDKALKFKGLDDQADYLAGNTARLLSIFKARLADFDCRTALRDLTGIQLCLNLEEPVMKGAEEGAAPPDSVPAVTREQQGLLGGGLDIEVSY